MSEATKKLLSHALKLPAKSRAMLAQKLIESLDEEGLDSAIDEADRRWNDYKQGKVKGIPIEEILPNLAAKFKRSRKS